MAFEAIIAVTIKIRQGAMFSTVLCFVVHLLATDCIVTTNVITLPYKIVYLDNKLVTATITRTDSLCTWYPNTIEYTAHLVDN